jgi:hypothetical protein
VSVLCCQVEVSSTGWSLVQRSPTECGESQMWSLGKLDGLGPQGAVEPLKTKRLKLPPVNLVSDKTLKVFNYRQRLLDWSSTNIWWGVQIMQLLSMQLPPIFCHFITLRPKYLPQNPILKHPQPVFLPECERSSYTHTHIKQAKLKFSYMFYGKDN